MNHAAQFSHLEQFHSIFHCSLWLILSFSVLCRIVNSSIFFRRWQISQTQWGPKQKINVTDAKKDTQNARTLFVLMENLFKIETKYVFHFTDFVLHVSQLSNPFIYSNIFVKSILILFESLIFVSFLAAIRVGISVVYYCKSHQNKIEIHRLYMHAARFVCEQILRRKFMLYIFVFSERKWNMIDICCIPLSRSLSCSLMLSSLACIHVQTEYSTVISVILLMCGCINTYGYTAGRHTSYAYAFVYSQYCDDTSYLKFAR